MDFDFSMPKVVPMAQQVEVCQTKAITFQPEKIVTHVDVIRISVTQKLTELLICEESCVLVPMMKYSV